MMISGAIGPKSRTERFTYDDLGRLSTAYGKGLWGRRYSYDRWGNRTAVYDAISGGNQIQNVTLEQSGSVPTNRIVSVGSVNYNYDASGNLTADGVHNYQYDAESRLVTVDGGSTASSAYDSANRRVKKTVGGLTTHYVWEGSHVIAEYNGSTGALISEYVYAGTRIVTREQGGALRYFLQDRLSTRLITNSSGNWVGREDHLPFGEDAGTGSGETEKHRFTTYERDSESSTDYAVNRQYQSANGRFMRPDPVGGSGGNPQSLNRYAYVANDPINLVDPLGLCTINIAITTNGLLSATQLRAMQDEIRRIYGDAGYQINFVLSNADYWLSVNARGNDYQSFYRNLPENAVGVTGKDGVQVRDSGRVFVDRLNASAGSAASYQQDSNNLGLGLGRAGAHEIGHYLLQQSYDSAAIQGLMHAGFHGEEWYSLATRGLWTLNAAQIGRLGSKVCLTPEKAPLNLDSIGPRLLGFGGGYPGWLYALSDFLDWVDSIGEGTVTSTYELGPPEEELEN